MTWSLVTFLLILSLIAVPASYSACTTAQLTTELQQDPQALGYAPLIQAGNDQGVTNLLNRVWTQAEKTGYRVWRGMIPSWEIINSYDPTEYAAVMADQIKANQLLGITNAQQVDTTNTNVKTILSSVFPAGGPTRTNLTNVVRVDGNRHNVLCNNGVTGSSATLAEVSLALKPLRP